MKNKEAPGVEYKKSETLVKNANRDNWYLESCKYFQTSDAGKDNLL